MVIIFICTWEPFENVFKSGISLSVQNNDDQ